MAVKHGIGYSVLILVILLLLFRQCDNDTTVTPEKPFKEEYIKGNPDTVIKEVVRYKKGVAPKPDTVYIADTLVIRATPDDSIRRYPLTENDSAGGTSVNVTVQGHLLDYDITRTCFNMEISRTDTVKQYFNKPSRTLYIGVFSGVMADKFTYGVNVLYTDKQRRYYGVGIDPVNKGGYFNVGVPIRLRR